MTTAGRSPSRAASLGDDDVGVVERSRAGREGLTEGGPGQRVRAGQRIGIRGRREHGDLGRQGSDELPQQAGLADTGFAGHQRHRREVGDGDAGGRDQIEELGQRRGPSHHDGTETGAPSQHLVHATDADRRQREGFGAQTRSRTRVSGRVTGSCGVVRRRERAERQVLARRRWSAWISWAIWMVCMFVNITVLLPGDGSACSPDCAPEVGGHIGRPTYLAVPSGIGRSDTPRPTAESDPPALRRGPSPPISPGRTDATVIAAEFSQRDSDVDETLVRSRGGRRHPSRRIDVESSGVCTWYERGIVRGRSGDLRSRHDQRRDRDRRRHRRRQRPQPTSSTPGRAQGLISADPRRRRRGLAGSGTTRATATSTSPRSSST